MPGDEPRTRQVQTVVPVQLSVLSGESDTTAAHVAKPRQDRGIISVTSIGSLALAEEVSSALYVTVPEKPRSNAVTEAPGQAACKSLFVSEKKVGLVHAPRKVHVPTTSPPHGCACRQPGGPLLLLPLLGPQPPTRTAR